MLDSSRGSRALRIAVLGITCALAATAVQLTRSVDPSVAAPAITLPLSTSGNRIVDATGTTVQLSGVNWFGIETGEHAPHGLWARDYREMLHQIRSLGYNTIRLPWSIASLQSSTTSSINYSLGANAQLQGKTPLQVMDAIIDGAAQEGLLILLDGHRLNDQAIPELWYGDGYTEQDWSSWWTTLAGRYANRPNVIGADLKNEPHGAATWGTGNAATDWNLAAERAGNAILAVNPKWLLVVEGIGGDVAGQLVTGHWWGGNLEGVRAHPVRLNVANKVVYSPHEYGPGVHDQTWFSDPNMATVLRRRWDNGFGFIHDQGIAPVLIGEFGGRHVGLDTVEGRWQNQFVDYLDEKHMAFTYWSWNPNSADTGGILQDDWKTVVAAKQAMLGRLLDGTSPAPSSSTSSTTPTTISTTSSVPAGGSTLSVTLTVTDDWGAGYCAAGSVKNNGTSAVRWKVPIAVQGTVTDAWNATITSVGSTTYAEGKGAWIDTVPAGGTVSGWGVCVARGSGTTTTTARVSTTTTRPPTTTTTRPSTTTSTTSTSTPPTTAPPTGSVTVKLTTSSDWGAGYCADGSVTNTTNAPVAWKVALNQQGTISTAWNVKLTSSGGVTYAEGGASWIATVPAKSSIGGWGFCANR